MNFEDVLDDINDLIGRELMAINPKTGHITIERIDRGAGSYYVSLNGRKATSRPLSQLKLIWNNLSHNRVAYTEGLLGGSGSSRHIPETVFANLPYVEHFKYKQKKHLYLSEVQTHAPGEIKGLGASELRKVKNKLDNLNKFDHYTFSLEMERALKLLQDSSKELRVKFPGEFKVTKLAKAEILVTELLSSVSDTFLRPLDEVEYIPIISSDEKTINLDSPEITGYYGSDIKDIEGESEDDLDDDDGFEEMSSSRIRLVHPTVSLIYDRLLHGELELQPEFQRKDRIWPPSNKTSLIESVLIGFPVPTFYFGERPDGDWLIIDGLQRITTLYDFMGNKFKLKGMKFLEEFNDCSFEDLPRPYQRKIREYQLHCHIITITKDSDRMVRELFQRINTYGVKMSYQEIRCALFPGSSVKFLRYLAERPAFLNATFGKVQPKRMKDTELILGALAFAISGYTNFNHSKFDDFLTDAMKKLNKFSLKEVTANIDEESDDVQPIIGLDETYTDPLFFELTKRIEGSFNLALNIFGIDRYKKELDGRVINKSLFEMITATFAMLSDEERDLVLQHREEIKSGLYGLLDGTKSQYVNWTSETFYGRPFEYSVTQSTGKKVTILYRFSNFKALLEDVLGINLSLSGVLPSK